MFQPGAMMYTQSFGSRPENVEVPHYDVRAPSSTDSNYPLGKSWIWPGNGSWTLINLSTAGRVLTATWLQSASSNALTAAMSGSPGSVVVSNPAVTSSSVIVFSRATTGGTPGQVSISAQSAGTFTLTSTGNETSTFNYLILN